MASTQEEGEGCGGNGHVGGEGRVWRRWARGVAAGVGDGVLDDDVVINGVGEKCEGGRIKEGSLDAVTSSRSAIWTWSTTKATIRVVDTGATGVEVLVGRGERWLEKVVDAVGLWRGG
jgi:hypothetical protein